jgi:hypothetical protein
VIRSRKFLLYVKLTSITSVYVPLFYLYIVRTDKQCQPVYQTHHSVSMIDEHHLMILQQWSQIVINHNNSEDHIVPGLTSVLNASKQSYEGHAIRSKSCDAYISLI